MTAPDGRDRSRAGWSEDRGDPPKRANPLAVAAEARYVDVERPALDHSDVRILVAVPHGTEGTGSQRTMALRFGDGQTADR